MAQSHLNQANMRLVWKSIRLPDIRKKTRQDCRDRLAWPGATILLCASRLRAVALAMFLALTLVGCASAPPEGVHPVAPFDVNRYLGKWYEIARLDHAFERGMTDVSASYQWQEDGSIKVINRGYDTRRLAWKEAVGRALFLGDRQTGSLKVSFFGPFYGGYHVISLDQQGYRWALVAGPDRDYLWILARDRILPDAVRAQLVSRAQVLGFATDQLIWVEQTRTDAH